MKPRPVPQRPESLRFIHQQQTIDTLAVAKESLDALNDDYCDLDHTNNPRLNTRPYEGAVLFGIEDDKHLPDRGFALLHSEAYDLDRGARLNFYKGAIDNKRVILSQTAIAETLKDSQKNRDQSFHSSKMNPTGQIVWGQPLLRNDQNVGVVQLAYTINENPDWTYPSNEAVDKIWENHQRPMAEVARSLADLALKTNSLSKSLEILPPVTPNSFVIQWDVVNSRRDAMSSNYAAQEAYLESWKAARAEITDGSGARILDRGDGEFIILPINQRDLNNTAAVGQYSKREIMPIVNELVKKHAEIAAAYFPDLYKKIKVTVGAGNIEDDQDGRPNGQVLYELKNLADSSAKPLAFSPSAEKLLF